MPAPDPMDASLDIPLPPSQDELPYEDGIPMETERHKLQMELLIHGLRPWLAQHPEQGYVGGNMFVYFSMEQVRGRYFRGPDVFVVLGVRPGERKSWVVWEEGKGPDVVIELLSPATAEADKTEKKAVYERQLRVGEYYWFDPFDADDWAGFELSHGVYQPLAPDPAGRLFSRRLGLVLLRWTGVYEGVEATWLRWATPAGKLLPTALEDLDTERARTEAERARAEAERQRAEAAEAEVARLRALLAARSDKPDNAP